MALPFIAGIVVGSAAVVAYNNRNKLKEVVSDGIEKGKDVASDIKEYAQEKVCKKEQEDVKKETVKKEAQKKEEPKKTTTARTKKPRATKKTTTKTSEAKSEQKDS